MDTRDFQALVAGGILLFLGEKLVWIALFVTTGPSILFLASDETNPDPGAGLALGTLALALILGGLWAAARIARRPLSHALLGLVPLAAGEWLQLQSSSMPWSLLGIAGALWLAVRPGRAQYPTATR
jgi:hypothetical protein